MKTFRVALTENELKAVIRHHASYVAIGEFEPETTKRIHDLTKRLKDDKPEIENDPRLTNDTSDFSASGKEGW